MAGPSINLVAIFSLVFLSLLGFFLLLHACFHHHDFWSLTIFIPAIIAFFVPAICFGYQKEQDVLLRDDVMDQQSFRNCRELGWSVSGVLLLATYLIPVLAWYNANLGWGGAVMVQIALTCWVWAFIVWLRIFVFYQQ